ncbi:MAG: hypothetical protein AABM31_02010 [Actinomycetota bacterium]|nr:hypothetical protein [Thermoleophilaceae bacterium]
MDLIAYLDPGTGSMLMTAIAGGVGAIAVTAKLYWGRLLVLLHIRKPEAEVESAQSRQQTDSA